MEEIELELSHTPRLISNLLVESQILSVLHSCHMVLVTVCVQVGKEFPDMRPVKENRICSEAAPGTAGQLPAGQEG